MGKCVFSPKWVSSYPWVMKAEDKYKAYCKSCKKTVDLGKMGEGALKSHEKSEKHKLNVRSLSQPVLDAFSVPPPPSDSPSSTQSSACSSSQTVTKPIQDCFAKNDVLKAEVLWTFHTIVNHNSYKSNESTSKLFKMMFLTWRSKLSKQNWTWRLWLALQMNMQINERKKEISPIFPNPMLWGKKQRRRKTCVLNWIPSWKTSKMIWKQFR